MRPIYSNKEGGDINLQLGYYELCYKKMAIYSNPTTIFFVGGCNYFSSEIFQIMVVKKLEIDVEVYEEEIVIPIGIKPRKEEILHFLREHYDDQSISFTRKSFGLLGFIKFTLGYYAILVDEVELVGMLASHEIFEVKKCKLIKLFDSVSNNRETRYYKDYLLKYISQDKPNFFFSYTYDLTHNLQDNFSFSMKGKEKFREIQETEELPLFQWNTFCKTSFQKATSIQNADKWTLRIIHGSYEQMNIKLYSNLLSVGLIGRRMVQNAGTRYSKRGLNEDVSKVFIIGILCQLCRD